MIATHRPELVMIRVLGPVDIVTTDGATAIGSRFGRKLLAVLALSANHMVSADQLAQILWNDVPPPSRDNTLQTYLSRLRHLLGVDRIGSEEHSYQLNVGVDQLDALVFDSMVGRAASLRDRPDECLEVAKGSLRYWRGIPFGEFATEDPFRLEAIRLDQLRLFAMELKLEAELALGREEMVVGTLQALVEEHPYRERMWYLLMSALAMGGRRVEALRAGSRLRSVLAEVGLDPATEILALEDEILREDPAIRARLRFVP